MSGTDYLIEAANLAYSMQMSRASRMHTAIVLSLQPIGVSITVTCHGDPNGPVMSYENLVTWGDVDQCRVNPLADIIRHSVRETQERAYGRHVHYRCDPERLP